MILITFLYPILTIFICLLFSAFFSASETAITAVSRARIHHLTQEGNSRATRVGKLRQHKEALIGAILIGNNLVTILASVLATTVSIHAWGDSAVFYVTAIMTVLVVVFGEVLPKTYAIRHAEETSLTLSWPLMWVFRLLYPISYVMHRFIMVILSLFGSSKGTSHSSADIIRGTIELHHQEGDVKKSERDMLGTILDLDEIEVGEIMIHRTGMETIESGQPLDAIIAQAIAYTHSRIPLWKDTPENIIGVLHVKSLLRELRTGTALTHETLMSILNRPLFIPETTSLKEQLQAFRREKQHFALVVDEYGALKGMVTLEDIIEEIVGHIDDEHDRHLISDILPAGDHAYMVEGTTTIRDVNRQLGWELPDEHASTIGGLILHEAREIPPLGAKYTFHGALFEVLRKRGNQITRVRMEKISDPDEFDTIDA